MCVCTLFSLSTPVGNQPNNVLKSYLTFSFTQRDILRVCVCVQYIELQTGCEPNSNYFVCEYKWKVEPIEPINTIVYILYSVHTKYNIAYKVMCILSHCSILLLVGITLSMLSRIFFFSIFFLPISNSLPLSLSISDYMLVKSRVKHLLLDRHNNFMIWINLPCHCHYAKHKYTRTHS